MADYVNKQVIELKEVNEENQNRATRSVKAETHLSDRRLRLYRLAAGCLGVLCVLQVTLNISLRLAFYNSGNVTEERDQLQTSYNTLTEERDQLQTSYNILTEERDQQQTSYNTLTKERDQLKLIYNILTKKGEQLQTTYNTLTIERDQLQKERDDLMRKFSILKQTCPEGWQKFESSWYFLSTVKKPWRESRQDCLERGADLVIANSDKEQEFLFSFNKRAWIGLTDSVTEGTWKWVDGTPLTTPSYWYLQQPDNGGDNPANRKEDCVELNTETWRPVKAWNDLSCLLNRYWICEKRV
ncbi:CD209 antigen-like protein C isoform X1 [Oncorhynchus masou masou]|uniref:CD209 antigen-like protein C isoform X1 n=1 Tax=Oncorhynchus masou masou TaxID=90313 RepID=UPI00318430BB